MFEPPPHVRLREAHAHLPWHGRSLSLLKLDACRSREECLHRIADEATFIPKGRWLLATGARVQSWTDPRWPSLAEIDRTTGATPTCIMSFDHHAALANSAALAASDVINIKPEGGVVCTDDHGPTGLLLESAAYHLWNSAPEYRER